MYKGSIVILGYAIRPMWMVDRRIIVEIMGNLKIGYINYSPVRTVCNYFVKINQCILTSLFTVLSTFA